MLSGATAGPAPSHTIDTFETGGHSDTGNLGKLSAWFLGWLYKRYPSIDGKVGRDHGILITTQSLLDYCQPNGSPTL